MNDMESVYDANSLLDAFNKSKKGTAWKESVQRYEMNLLRNINQTQKEMKDGTYEQKDFYEFKLHEREKQGILSQCTSLTVWYMDDIYIIHEDKEYLKGLLNDIQGICDELGLFINPKKTQIVKLSHGFTFLKIKYNLTETGKVQERISKDSVTRMRRKLKKFRKLMDAGEMSFDDVRCAYASWKGGVSHYDSYNVVKSMDKLFDELFIHPFIGGGHRDEQNSNEQK